MCVSFGGAGGWPQDMARGQAIVYEPTPQTWPPSLAGFEGSDFVQASTELMTNRARRARTLRHSTWERGRYEFPRLAASFPHVMSAIHTLAVRQGDES